MTTTRIAQIFDNAPPLQPTGCTHGQYALHVPGATLALGAETALTPQDALTNNPLSLIVGRLHTRILHKGPQMGTMFENPAASAAKGAWTSGTILKKGFHTFHQGDHPSLKPRPLQCSITNTLSQLQYLLGQTVKLTADLAQGILGLADRLEIPFQMRPANLASPLKYIIGAPAVTDQHPAKGIKQLAGRFLASLGLNHKDRRPATAQGPQPASLAIASTPAGLVGIADRLLSDVRDRFLVRRFQCLRQLSLAVAQTPQAHRNRKDLVDHRQGLALAGVEHPGQNRHQRQDARTEVVAFDLVRQRLIDPRATGPAAIDRLNILNDFGFDGWDIESLMTQGLVGRSLECCSAATAHLGFQMNTLFDFLRRQQSFQMRPMPLLGSAFFTSTPRQCCSDLRRIRGWRFGRIPRVHPQKSLKLLYPLLQLCIFLFQLLDISVFVHNSIIGQRQGFRSITLNQVNAYEKTKPVFETQS